MLNYKNPRLTCAATEANPIRVVCLSGVEFAYKFSHTCHMVAKPARPAERLAAAVLSRRDELDMSQLDVWQAGGPSNTTLTKIENGKIESLERVTARRLDKGLRWQEGSAKTVWLGGEPTPVAEVDELEAAARAANLSPEAVEHILRIAAEDRQSITDAGRGELG